MGMSKAQKRKAEEVEAKVAKEDTAEAMEVEGEEVATPLPKKEKKAKKVLVEAEEEPAPKAKKAKKAKEAAAAAIVEEPVKEEAPAPEAKKEKKGKGKKAENEKKPEKEDDEEESPAPEAKSKEPTAKVEVDSGAAAESEQLTVFVGGIPWATSEEVLRKDFAECGEIEKLHMPMNEEGKPRGIAFITYKSKAGVDAALKFDGDDYGGRTLKVNVANSQGSKGSGKGEKGKGKGNNELTAFVRGLSFETEEDSLRTTFAECGEIESLRMPLNDEGKCKGIAFITFKAKEGFEKAKELDETELGGRTIHVSQAGEGGKGKDGKGKGKDGKGKGKDGKGKGKDGKGKGKSKGKGKATSEGKAKSQGSIVASEGKKQTFEESDDE